MKECLTFDDVLIKPKFSTLTSRKDVDLSVSFKQDYVKEILKLRLPILSANMDTVTEIEMAKAMYNEGGLGVLHRFGPSEYTKRMFNEVGASTHPSYRCCAVSVGLGELECQRATDLYNAGARIFVLDVAHGAQKQVVEMYKWLKENLSEIFVIVGNFATAESCSVFWAELNAGGICYYRTKKGELHSYGVDAFKIGIGPGSACTTRIKTGVGVSQLSAVMEVAEYFKDHTHRPMIIADGGMKTPGDIAKAIAAGADLVMLGGMLAGTEETPGDVVDNKGTPLGSWSITNISDPKAFEGQYKKYRGSASKESYADQGKDASHRTAEGESFTVPYKGSVVQVLQDIEGGLRSAFTYVGARNVREFQEKAEFVKTTANGTRENGAHGKI